jgi:hypothetical protein
MFHFRCWWNSNLNQCRNDIEVDFIRALELERDCVELELLQTQPQNDADPNQDISNPCSMSQSQLTQEAELILTLKYVVAANCSLLIVRSSKLVVSNQAVSALNRQRQPALIRPPFVFRG